MGTEKQDGHFAEDYLANTPQPADPVAQLPPGLLKRLRTQHRRLQTSSTPTQSSPTHNSDENMALADLVEALQDEQDAVRVQAVRKLGQLQEEAPLGHLLLALHDASWLVRCSAAQALGKLGKRVPVEPLLTALQDKDESVRAAAAGALGNIQQQATIPALLLALQDSAWHVREMAVLALGSMQSSEALQYLALALQDDNASVRDAVLSLQESHPEYYSAIRTARRDLADQEQDIGHIIAPQHVLSMPSTTSTHRLRIQETLLRGQRQKSTAQFHLPFISINQATQTIRERANILTKFTLALWHIRECWHLLSLAAIGMMVSVILVCTVPLYAHIALSSGLHTLLTATPQSSQITLYNPGINLQYANFLAYKEEDNQQEIHYHLPTMLDTRIRPQVIVQSNIGQLSFPTNTTLSTANTTMLQFNGYETEQITPHTHLSKGRLPQPTNDAIEIALTSENARALQVDVGAKLNLFMYMPFNITPNMEPLPLRVVGIFEVNNEAEPFWHGQHFHPTNTAQNSQQSEPRTTYQALIHSQGAIVYIREQYKQALIDSNDTNLHWQVHWYYHIDATQVDVQNIALLQQGLKGLEENLANVQSPLQAVEQYQQRVAQVQMPTNIILCFITGMVVLFVGITSSQVVENRSGFIAVLRSRGASRKQILGAFTTPHICIGLLVLSIGPLLAIPTSQLLATTLLPKEQLQYYTPLHQDIVMQVKNIIGYAVATVIIGFAACLLAIQRATTLDIHTLRQQHTRTTLHPFWQRYHLDLFAALLALGGYSFALSETFNPTHSIERQILLVTPLTLVAALCSILLFLLLFLRCFPYLLTQMARLAARSRSAAPTLALAQISRAPRNALSSTLLLSLTTAFAIFTLLFTASQEQRAVDTATYIVGADFSGTFVNTGTTLLQETTALQSIPGVVAASTGYTTTAYTKEEDAIGIKAIEPETFNQAVIWQTHYATKPLPSLLKQLQQQRAQAIKENIVPAFVDKQTWDKLKLTAGKPFVLNDSFGGAYGKINITFIALEPVEHIPTYHSGFFNTKSSEGLLVDFQTYAYSYTNNANVAKIPIGVNIGPNYFWLRTYDDSNAVNAVRTVLERKRQNTNMLNTLYYDRRAILDNLYHDPLYLSLTGLLTLGALIPLILAIIGCFITTWITLRQRLLKFSLLRAIGTAPSQLASMITWEQAPLYATLIVLGIGAGWLLSTLTLPMLVVSSLTTQALVAMSGISSDSLLTTPDLPSIQMIIPTEVWLAVGILVCVGAVTLGIMIRTVLRLSLNKILRINED